jgi:hypothetical protein
VHVMMPGGLLNYIQIFKNAYDDKNFETFRGQFFKALHDNLRQRFSSTDALGADLVLCKVSWPENALHRALYGKQDAAFFNKIFQFDSVLSAEIVLEYSLYKCQSRLGANLKQLVMLL